MRYIIGLVASAVFAFAPAFAQNAADDDAGFICSTSEPSQVYYQVFESGAPWQLKDGLTGSTSDRIRIGVYFLDGSEEQRNYVKTFAPYWTGPSGAPIEWVFDNRDKAHIRITFKDFNRSRIGREGMRETDRNEPTMWLKDVSPANKERSQRVILHEFGHAIGLHHEQLHPAFPLTWKTDVITADMLQSDWCTITRVQNGMKILVKLTPEKCNEEVKRQITGEIKDPRLKVCPGAPAFDESSIMLYHIYKSWNEEGIELPSPRKISKNDFACARSLYPHTIVQRPPRVIATPITVFICKAPYSCVQEVLVKPPVRPRSPECSSDYYYDDDD